MNGVDTPTRPAHIHSTQKPNANPHLEQALRRRSDHPPSNSPVDLFQTPLPHDQSTRFLVSGSRSRIDTEAHRLTDDAHSSRSHRVARPASRAGVDYDR